jgi:hypothetical protein
MDKFGIVDLANLVKSGLQIGLSLSLLLLCPPPFLNLRASLLVQVGASFITATSFDQ